MMSIALTREKPVRSPMVPPITPSWASNVTFLSFSISTKVAVSKNIRIR